MNAIKNDENMKKKVEEIADKVNAQINKPIKISNDGLKLNKNQETNKIFKEDFNSNINNKSKKFKFFINFIFL